MVWAALWCSVDYELAVHIFLSVLYFPFQNKLLGLEPTDLDCSSLSQSSVGVKLQISHRLFNSGVPEWEEVINASRPVPIQQTLVG